MPTTGDRTTAEVAWRRLRMLRTAADLRWFDYVAGDPAQAKHVVQLPSGRRRQILRDEIIPWIWGVADAHGGPYDQLDTAEHEDAPPLVPIREAAGMFGITVEGLDKRIAKGGLVAVFLASATGRGGWQRHLFADQIRTELGEPSNWDAIRDLIPPATRIVDVGYRPGPSPKPLPVPLGIAERDRRITALMIGHEQGWYDYRSAAPGDRYTVGITTADREPRVLVGAQAMPYVLGHGDVHEHPELVAYRDGLG